MVFHLIVNPVAGSGQCLDYAQAAATELRRHGAQIRFSAARDVDDFVQLASYAVDCGQDVVAVGGDGSVRAILGTVARADANLGIIPSGRGNDLARELDIPSDPIAAAGVLLAGHKRLIDLIESAGQYVVGSLYVGIDSLASELVNQLQWLPSPVQYPIAALRALIKGKPHHFSVTVDGRAHEQLAYLVVCANSRFYGSGMKIAPLAKPDDGYCDVVIIEAVSKFRLLANMPRLYDGSHAQLDFIKILRGRHVTIRSNVQAWAYGDGEILSHLPVQASMRAGRLSVFTP